MSSCPRIEELWAHTPNDNGEPQPLRDHLCQVAELAERFASAFNAGELGRITGLLHDVGKASNAFQSYLRDCEEARRTGRPLPRTSTDHKLAGIRYALSLGDIGGIVALAVLGHHGGLLDANNVESRFEEARQNEGLVNVIECASRDCGGLPNELPRLPVQWTINDNSSLEMLARMLFSCLVDADSLDAEEHWDPERTRTREWSRTLSDLWVRFQNDQANLHRMAQPSIVNTARREIYEACLAAADLPPGIFRLTVPTGGGKTRSAMAFALKHAIKHNLQRVIFAIPYTSIIDQNAAEYRRIFWNEGLIEHHSAIDLPETDDYSKELLRAELATENWNAPVIITTTVQLFDSLFSNKRSKCRKLHNIARSVLVLDEVQTLPVRMLQPILDVLKDLVTHYKVTVVLSTATQPAFSGDRECLSGFPDPVEIVPNPQRYFCALRRVNYRVVEEPWTWERVAREMRNRQQVLCVVNSRRDARQLFELLGDTDTLHLSTLMCQAHRRRVLDEIRRRLAAGEPCLAVTTQVVEAGVDIDFPVVFRAQGPLDRIVQAAGRCNREGRMLPEFGEVIVFRTQDGHAPSGSYSIEMQVAATILAEANGNLDDPNVIDGYFEELYRTMRRQGLDSRNISASRSAGNFEQTARNGRLIDDDVVPVVVRYEPAEVDAILQEVQSNGYATRKQWRKLQQYVVNVYTREYDEHIRYGRIWEVIDGLGVWQGYYDDRIGLSDAVLDPCDLIIS